MSWNGTVRCGHCYDKGHNKRSCPKLAEFAKENPDSWAAKRLKDSKERGKVRRCTYCNLKGHNRATCTHLTVAKEAYVKEAKKWRKGWIEWMVADGFNIGTLIECSPQGYPSRGHGVYMLRAFNWTTLNPQMQNGYYADHAFHLIHPSEMTTAYWGNLPRHEELMEKGSPDIKVVGPVAVTAEALLALAPAWWKKGYASSDEKLKDVFNKDKTHRDFWENGNKD